MIGHKCKKNKHDKCSFALCECTCHNYDLKHLEIMKEVRKEISKTESLEEHDKHCQFCKGLGYGKKQEQTSQ